MNQDLSITALVLQASLVVQIVMAGLAITSFTSWTVIFGKLFGLRRVRASNDEFEREFRSGRSLTELNAGVGKKGDTAPLERIFASGMREFLKLREKKMEAGAQLDGARRAMRASYQRELDVTVALHTLGSASMKIQQQAWRGDTLLAEGEIRIGCVDDGTFRPVRIPNQILDALR